MTRIHPFFVLQTALVVLLSLFLAATAKADQPAQRIVSVGGAVTEIVYALGEDHRLVARDTTSNHPAEALELPDVGYIRRLSPEGLLSVNPDLIIAQEGAGPPEAVALLQEAAVPMIEIPEGHDTEAVVAKITAVAEALGVAEKGAALAGDDRKQIEAAQAGATGLAGKRVLFILSMAGGRIMAGGVDTPADGIIGMVGATNATADFEGFKPVTDEAILASGADVILVMDRTGDMGITDDALFSHPAIAATPAGQNRAVVRMDGMMMLGFSVRTPEAVRELSKALQQVGG
ncbi:iron complex transport system substrate-binding protein [Lutimaribacter pacificus]|uniref:Iron complex transport system substrate-binding protein n=1 Tax=Lutimaribacter pacificus TaxID=391948 RepID=A0A1H0HNK0_9RHOB|nr:ABC transporter substrate-binding protein [Lutimaribacter pacificus]SDO20717.1 iron complex transport system substrate-binding protein [Lutimaribacter pacificus]SHK33478.1 iron complex transport system substrate-binding protein [Lutimaribacter pacificus]